MDDKERIKELELRLAEAEETLDAIRRGEVDALLVSGPEGDRVYALQGADYPYRVIVEQMAEGAVTIIEDGTIVYSNRRLAEMIGHPPGSVTGKHFSVFVVPKDRHLLEGLMVDPKKTRQEMRLMAADGSQVPVYVSAVRLQLEEQEVVCLVVIDLTSQEKLEEQLRQAQKMEAVGTLAGGIAHDFNNILAAIVGFADLLREALEGHVKEKRYAERVFEGAIRGREVVKQLLAFSRQMEHEKRRISLASLVKETVKLLRASIPTTITIELDVEADGAFVTADAVQVQQVLMNLATNAADAMNEKGGVLTIGLAALDVTNGGAGAQLQPGKYVKMWVQDTGAGMSEETKNRIFDPFFTTKGPGQGTGLGLSTVLGIVQAHEGVITVDSSPGAGSTFNVYLPASAAGHAEEAWAEEEAPRGKGHILFVDDEESLVDLGRDMLEGLGYEVTATTTSTRALALFLNAPDSFDAVITDQTMPELSGIDLARQLIEARADIPIFLTTGFSHLVDEKRARRAGIKAFLMKPLTRGEIARALRDVLSTAGE